MPEISAQEWEIFLRDVPEAHILQTGQWGELKSHFGWMAGQVLSNSSASGLNALLKVDWPSIADYVISDGPVYLQFIKNFKNLEQFEDANSCYYKYRLFSMDKRSWSDKEKYLDGRGLADLRIRGTPQFYRPLDDDHNRSLCRLVLGY